jgi:alpha,alpha-trehalose phosphorylase
MRALSDRYDAVLFDLDGVLTSTADLHTDCWKRVLDVALAEWNRSTGSAQAPFDPVRDYVAHVDGKSRCDGVRDFLRARGIVVPEVANRKQALVERALARDGVEGFPGSLRWVRHLRAAGVRTAVVSSSANCDDVLRAAGMADLFELTVDGLDIVRLALPGKPAPDAFLEAARRMDVAPRNAVVVEDALAGVAAGRAGCFGLVIGVARNAAPADLRSAGADIVVGDLEELLP